MKISIRRFDYKKLEDKELDKSFPNYFLYYDYKDTKTTKYSLGSGVLDKNGKEVFSGDIITESYECDCGFLSRKCDFKQKDGQHTFITIISFKDGCFIDDDEESVLEDIDSKDIEVIGNTYYFDYSWKDGNSRNNILTNFILKHK